MSAQTPHKKKTECALEGDVDVRTINLRVPFGPHEQSLSPTVEQSEPTTEQAWADMPRARRPKRIVVTFIVGSFGVGWLIERMCWSMMSVDEVKEKKVFGRNEMGVLIPCP